MEDAAISKILEKYPNYKEYLWFKTHEEELIKKYYNRYVVIKDEQVLGVYGSMAVAVNVTDQEHRPGTYVVQHCVPRSERKIIRMPFRKILTVND